MKECSTCGGSGTLTLVVLKAGAEDVEVTCPSCGGSGEAND